jgi:IclR family transcriptional regulator, acetate operon repressor
MRHSESVRAPEVRARQPDPAEQREPNTALKKALSVLELFAGENRPMTASMVAVQLDMSRQAAGRLLHQLEDLGLVLRLPEDFYIVGPRANKLALDVIGTSHISAAVHAILEDVVARIGETSNIGMLDRYELVYIDRVECNWPLREQLRPGSRVPSHCTAMGKLLLAHLSTRRRERLLSVMPLERFTDYTITDPEKLSEHFRQIREQGYSINNQEDSVGLIALAVPIRNSNNKVFAGLAIHGPEARMSIDAARTHVGLLQKAALQLGEALEFSSADD